MGLAKLLNKLVKLLPRLVNKPLMLVKLLNKLDKLLIKPNKLLNKLWMKLLVNSNKLKLIWKKSEANLEFLTDKSGGLIENCTNKRNISQPVVEELPSKLNKLVLSCTTFQ